MHRNLSGRTQKGTHCTLPAVPGPWQAPFTETEKRVGVARATGGAGASVGNGDMVSVWDDAEVQDGWWW